MDVKKDVTTHIMESIRKTGRFLRMIDSQWALISDREIRQKIAHALQYRLRNTGSASEQPRSIEGPAAAPPPAGTTTSATRTAVAATLNAHDPVSSSGTGIPNHHYTNAAQLPFSIHPNQQQLCYNNLHMYQTRSLSKQPLEQYPFCNDSSYDAERQFHPPSNHLPLNFDPTYHLPSHSNMMYNPTAYPSMINGGMVCPLDRFIDRSLLNQPLAHSYNAGMPYNHLPPSNNISDSVVHMKPDAAPDGNHSAPPLTDHGKVDPSLPPQKPLANANTSHAPTHDNENTFHVPASSTTFDTMDSGINSTQESGSTTSETINIHNAFDHEFVCYNNYIHNTNAVSSNSNIQQQQSPSLFEPRPGFAIPYNVETCSMMPHAVNEPTTTSFGYNDSTTIPPWLLSHPIVNHNHNNNANTNNNNNMRMPLPAVTMGADGVQPGSYPPPFFVPPPPQPISTTSAHVEEAVQRQPPQTSTTTTANTTTNTAAIGQHLSPPATSTDSTAQTAASTTRVDHNNNTHNDGLDRSLPDYDYEHGTTSHP